MDKIINFVIFVVVVAILWWVLNEVLSAFGVPAPYDRLAVVGFALVVVFAIIDYLRGGVWFWTKR